MEFKFYEIILYLIKKITVCEAIVVSLQARGRFGSDRRLPGNPRQGRPLRTHPEVHCWRTVLPLQGGRQILLRAQGHASFLLRR